MIQYRLVQKTKVIEGVNSIGQLVELCENAGFQRPFLSLIRESQR
ncbi:MAG: hypothetical protein Q4E53_13820 [Eubacteriales bacterium]|nr:hypothetical protein [Eubacteriales bacterium]